MTGSELLVQAVARLRAAGIDDPARDARRLLAHVLGIPAGRLTLVLPDPVTDEQAGTFDQLIWRRSRREPVSHLTGLRAFFGRDFVVTADVLDPRPETEILIATALDQPFGSVLDLGTGSGCILVTLLAERPDATGLGTDLSPAALEVARLNAHRLAVADRARFAAGGWYEAVPGALRFDLVVSNPPYIALSEMSGLAPELGFEPQMALTDGNDGLDAYRAITSGAARHLEPGGRLIVEIGPTQAASVSALFAANGFADIKVMRDLDGRDRVVVGVLTPQIT